MVIHHADDRVTLHHGDCIEVLRGLPDCSVDAVVTDPPYGLEFMGKEWDSFKTYAGGNPNMKPKGTTVEPGDDAGDFRAASYGYRQKNPRCRRCGKLMRGNGACKCPEPQIDTRTSESAHQFQYWCEDWARELWRVLKPGGHLLAFGGTRTWHRLACAIEDAGFEVRDSIAWLYGSGFPKSLDVSKAIDKAAGVEREVVGVDPRYVGMSDRAKRALGAVVHEGTGGTGFSGDPSVITAPATPAARQWQGWGTALKPAHEPIVVARKPLAGTVAGNVLAWGTGALNIDGCRVGVDGGTRGSNYAKTGLLGIGGKADIEPIDAGRWPANVVLDEHQAAALDAQSGESTSRFYYLAKADSTERPRVDGTAHPTVKPLELMRWLVRLVTPPGGLVLDPFAGSGTTAEACIVEGFRCVTIEREADYLPLIVARVTKPIQPVLL